MAKLLKVKKQEISCYEEKKNLLKKVKLAISQSAKRFSGYEQHVSMKESLNKTNGLKLR